MALSSNQDTVCSSAHSKTLAEIPVLDSHVKIWQKNKAQSSFNTQSLVLFKAQSHIVLRATLRKKEISVHFEIKVRTCRWN